MTDQEDSKSDSRWLTANELPPRFWAKVNKTEGCWIWTANISPRGFAIFTEGGKPVPAHRVLFKATHGDIPEGAFIRQTCGDRTCVNPDHLRAVTREDRFWEKVDKSGSCWLWTGAIYGGYGCLSWHTRQTYAHRVSYELCVGTIPKGLHIDHLCRVRNCVNPDHLEAVTNWTNGSRGVGACAINARKTHCKHGHEFTPENTYTTKAGHRSCRTCNRMRSLETHRRKRSVS